MSFPIGDKGKKGGEWKSQIYFDPDSSSQDKREYSISDSELIETMRALIIGHEKIIQVEAFKCPLTDWQMTQYYLNHQIVVIKTEQWWWSIEKNEEGITIQRCKEKRYVKDRYRRAIRRTPVDSLKRDEGRRNMNDLIEYLYKKNELNRKYNWTTDNCQHFAKRLFDEIARSKVL